jgi:hypothetical protein
MVTNGADSLNVEDLQLMFQYCSSTGKTLSRTLSLSNPALQFWQHDVPELGFKYHFILHLTLAIAAYHLAYLQADDALRQRYISRGKKGFIIGLAEFTRQLANLQPETGGPLLIAAMLVCWCAFADGPAGPGDLLVCNVSSDNTVTWKHPIKGFRSILEAISGGNARATTESARFIKIIHPAGVKGPSYSREGFPRIDWHEALYAFREFVMGREEQDTKLVVQELDRMIEIYNAVYGDQNGEYDGSQDSRHILGWLYRMDGKFVLCLQLKQPTALLVLAYFAVLFKALDTLWCMDKWAKHLIANVNSLLEEGYHEWLLWPKEQVGLKQ